MAAPVPERADVLRWYTRARRIPTLIGKLPGSERGLPFGPYTLTQGVGGSMAALAAIQTEPLWGHWGYWGDKVVIVVLTVVAVVGLRLVKPGGRDPLTALLAVTGVFSAGRYGTHRGRRLRRRRPVRVSARVRVRHAAPALRVVDDPVGLPAPARPVVAAVPSSLRAMTSLERLLAGATPWEC